MSAMNANNEKRYRKEVDIRDLIEKLVLLNVRAEVAADIFFEAKLKYLINNLQINGGK